MSAVTVYTSPGCRPCKRVINILESYGVDVEVVDLEDPQFADARNYVTQVLGSKSTPVIVSDVHPPILGYQPNQVKALVEALTTNEREV